MAEDDACDGETWYQFGFPEPERKEYLALQAERPTEVVPADRRTLLEGFDFLALVSHSFFRIGERPVVVIWRRNGAVDVIVRSADCTVDQRRTLKGADAEKLLSAVLATHADTWTEPFEPKELVLDGYSWDMTVCAGSRYFDCCGDNAVPREMAELLRAVADAGLPLTWDGEEIAFAHGNGKGDHE